MRGKLLHIKADRVGRGSVYVETDEGALIDISNLVSGYTLRSSVSDIAHFDVTFIGRGVEHKYSREGK